MFWLKRFLTPPLLIIAAVLMWVEESLWQWLKKMTGWVAHFPLLRQFEAMILRLPPYAVMIAFLMPMITLFPLKLLAVYCLTRGYWISSLALLVTAKLLGTAIAARMYVVCQPKLMTIQWFFRLHNWLISLRDRLYTAVRSLWIYKIVRAKLSAIKMRVRQILAKFRSPRGIWFRWRAIRRLHRQRSKRCLQGRAKSAVGQEI